jgi:ATP-binding cassette subfamily B protein
MLPIGERKKVSIPIQEGFELRDVSFRYPGSERLVLKGINLRIQAGQTIAFVGENGAGKTTLVKLLLRLYDPTNGEILLDGAPLPEYDIDDLRRHISAVFQDYACFHLTVRENIGMGDLDRMDDRDALVTAAQLGCADTFIARLPEGYETFLGKHFPGGVDLSGGEWQRIALARACMREAQILILDEPTAELDARAEYEVYQRFKALRQGKTTILISHRFSTVRMADHIMVIHEGQIIEGGTHEELMRLGGRYAELFTMQAERYQ